ncbi:MAG: dTDP-4-dehydrorhamnose reductase [Bacteroidia bacterium]|nr:dTDP-4-dehydrorhamnose reductase [Bacteroidia bacterium]
MANILITGANGQVGKSIHSIQSLFNHHRFHFATKKELDITNFQSISDHLDYNQIDWIINCAAYTAVDKAEEEEKEAYLINETGVINIGKASLEKQIGVIHISTDYVYHSNFGIPFKETSITNPQSVYASSKLAGELAILRYNPKSFILRTSWVYSEYGHNFVKTMLRLGEARETIRVVCDQIGAPTYAKDLAMATIQLIDTQAEYGIYNFANSGTTSWYNFTNAIFAHVGIDCMVIPIRTDEYPTAALRPPYSIMNLSKIQNALQIEIRGWEDALKECLSRVGQMV